MEQYEGKRVRGPNGEIGVIRNGQIVIESGPAAPAPAPVAAPAPLQRVVAAPEKPEVRQVGNQFGVVDGSGNFTPTYTAPEPPKPAKDPFADESALRKEFSSAEAVKNYNTILPLYAAGIQAGDNKAGDLQLIYALGKVFDPGSVVREGELQMAQDTGGVADKLKGLFSSVQGGSRLGENVRRNLLNELRTRGSAAATAYNVVRKDYATRAQRYGFDPDAVLGTHPGAAFQQIEADFLDRPVRNLDGTEGPAPLDQQQPQASHPDDPWERAPEGVKPTMHQDMAFGIADRMIRTGASYDQVRDFFFSQGLSFQKAQLSEALAAGRGRVNDGSTGLGVIQGALKPLDRAAEGIQNGVNALFGTDFDAATKMNQERDAYFQQNPTTSGGRFMGNVLGGAVVAAPFGPVVGGAVSNSLLGDSRDAEGIAKDAVVGAIGGKIADTVIGGAARIIAPSVRPEVQRLADEGIDLTPGQIAGGAAQRMEDRATSLPLAGDAIINARQKGYEQFNRAVANRALRPLGLKVPASVAPGHDTVKHVYETLGKGYNAVLPRVNVSLDRTFATRMVAAQRRSNLPADQAARLDEIVRREIGEAFRSGKNGLGRLTGQEYKMLDERVSDIAAGFKGSDDPYTREMGRVLDSISGQIRAMARRQNPQVAGTLRSLDEGYANFVRMRTAAAKAPMDGIFTPAQLRTAVSQADGSVGKGATARGDALMQDLASDASRVLPSRVPNSGTTERGNLTDPVAWLGGVAARGAYAERVRSAVQKVAVRQPGRASQTVANTLRRIPPGPAGAAAIQQLLFPSSQ